MDQLQKKVEGAFGGADLSGVSAHAGGGSSSSSSLGALAFTSGSSIPFAGAGGAGGGLAHEASHVVQQSSGRVAAGGSSPYTGMF